MREALVCIIQLLLQVQQLLHGLLLLKATELCPYAPAICNLMWVVTTRPHHWKAWCALALWAAADSAASAAARLFLYEGGLCSDDLHLPAVCSGLGHLEETKGSTHINLYLLTRISRVVQSKNNSLSRLQQNWHDNARKEFMGCCETTHQPIGCFPDELLATRLWHILAQPSAECWHAAWAQHLFCGVSAGRQGG